MRRLRHVKQPVLVLLRILVVAVEPEPLPVGETSPPGGDFDRAFAILKWRKSRIVLMWTVGRQAVETTKMLQSSGKERRVVYLGRRLISKQEKANHCGQMIVRLNAGAAVPK
jgi:hypothetical protein